MAASQTSNLVRALAESYSQLRAQREALDAQVKELKKQEEEVKAQLINELSLQQMPSVRFDGLGRFVVKTATTYSITDIDQFCLATMQRMVDNAKAGRPFSDGLMLQKRPSKIVIEELMETGYIQADALGTMGLAQEDRLDLTFTRAK